jgi:small-conductance mechanosensitive channel
LLYEIFALIIEITIRMRKGPEGEAKMLTSFSRVLAIMAVLIASLYSMGVLKTIGVVAAGFAGMLLGWSLQAPVSGLAAWILITLMRPFRISDRVQFPSLGLTGDVKRVGAMYTVLDQVGGTVGSEEPIGRDILIPNAMLFSQVAINYTMNAEKTTSPFFLDEVVIRLTYDSDWDTAEEILRNAAYSVTADVIKETGHEPYVRSDIWDYGILMRLRYMTKAKDRPRITHEIVRHVFKEIQANPRVDMAIPFVYSYRKGSSALDRHLYPESQAEILEVNIAEIADLTDNSGNHWQDSDVEALMHNIKEHGLLQPMVLQRQPGGGYKILAGALRLIACKRLGWKTVPAIVSDHP